MSEKITFQELIEAISKQAGTTKEFTHDFVKGLTDVINEGLDQDGQVSIAGFGKFELREMDEREGFNPQTNEKIIIPAHNKVVFKPYKDLRELVNAPYAHLEAELIEENDEEPESPQDENAKEPAQPASSSDTGAGESEWSHLAETRKSTGAGEPENEKKDEEAPWPSEETEEETADPFGFGKRSAGFQLDKSELEDAKGGGDTDEGKEDQDDDDVVKYTPDFDVPEEETSLWEELEETKQPDEQDAGEEAQNQHTEEEKEAFFDPGEWEKDTADKEPVGEEEKDTQDTKEEDVPDRYESIFPVEKDYAEQEPEESPGAEKEEDEFTEKHETLIPREAAGADTENEEEEAETVFGTKEQEEQHIEDDLNEEDTYSAAPPLSSRKRHSRKSSGGGWWIIAAAVIVLIALVVWLLLPGGFNLNSPAEKPVAIQNSTPAKSKTQQPAQQKGNAQSNPAAAQPKQAQPPAKAQPASSQQSTVEVTVKRGQTLWGLADNHYANPYLWPWIYNANTSKIDNPNLIRTGQILAIPKPAAADGGLTASDSLQVALGYVDTYKWYKDHKLDNAKFYLYAAVRYSRDVFDHTNINIDPDDLAFANRQR